MRFKAWFVRWKRSFYRLLMLDVPPYKSDRRRNKEHVAYVRAKSSRKGRYRVVEKKRRRNGKNHKMLSVLMEFTVLTLCIIFLPFGLLYEGCKKVKKRYRSHRMSRGRATCADSKSQKRRSEHAAEKHHDTPPSAVPQAVAPMTCTEDQRKATVKNSVTMCEEKSEINACIASDVENSKPDEDAPKSVPRNEKDRYIRKRLVIEWDACCDPAILSRPEIGSYLEVVAESDHPHTQYAVKLLFDGVKVGCIPKEDQAPFLTCLKLGRKVYGVITDTFDGELSKKYELEMWFEGK